MTSSMTYDVELPRQLQRTSPCDCNGSYLTRVIVFGHFCDHKLNQISIIFSLFVMLSNNCRYCSRRRDVIILGWYHKQTLLALITVIFVIVIVVFVVVEIIIYFVQTQGYDLGRIQD